MFATRPPDFVAARNAAVKELKRTKKTDTATTVARFRRPGWPDWALNVTAEQQPELVEAFAEAANQMREAQAAVIEGRDGPDVRVALNELREQTGELTKRAAETLEEAARPPETPQLTARLAEIAGNASAVGELVAGLLGSGDPGAVDLFAGLEPAAGSRPRRAPRQKQAPKRAASKPATAEPDAAALAAERRRRQRELQRAEREHESSMRALARADAELASATAAVTKAEAELARATGQRDRAAAKRGEAAVALDRTKTTLDELRGDVDER